MPVRIYDIAKKLGIESKEVIAKAKEFGIAAARVPSSSLDKITAEYLEDQLRALLPPPPIPALTPPPAPPPPVVAPAPAPGAAPEVKLEPPPTAPALPTEAPAPAPKAPEVLPHEAVAPAPPQVVLPPTPAPVVVEPPAPAPAAPPLVEVRAAPPAIEKPAEAPPAAEAPIAAPPPAPAPPPPPLAPPRPKVGDLIGRIQLPIKPKVGEKVGSVKLPPRPTPAGRGEVRGRADQRPARPPAPSGRQQAAPGRAGQGQRGAEPAPRPVEPKFIQPPADAEVITIKPPIIVRDLAERLKRRPYQLIADLIELKVLANVNQAIEEPVAQRLCAKYGFRFEVEKREKRAAIPQAQVRAVELDIEDKPEELKLRPPVVTIMGHVDHGKTSLLDVIRKSDVAGGEAGGITQHIGAYTICFPHPDRKKELAQITFLDTPGHAAFSAMRARGANVTDLVVLVVAANDGVMPQTIEALNHAKAAKVPILVAVNKIDHPNSNPLKVRQQLQDKGLVPDAWGGETIFVDVSALTKQGVDKLIEMILLQADLLELKANPNRRAKGNVIESGLSAGGPTATLLVRKGTLRVGDVVICGQNWGKVRALINEEGKRLKEAAPSVAVKMLGLNGVPEAGADFSVLEDDKSVRELVETRIQAHRAGALGSRAKVTLESLFETLASSNAKALKVVVKADAQGSVEAIVEALKKIESNEVALEIIHSAVGTISESDVHLASASSAIILGFHSRIDASAAELAKQQGIQIKLYSIIYELIDQVKEAMAGLLEPIIKETTIGVAEVRKVFELSKGGKVAGCIIANGRVVKGKARVTRRKNVIYEGILQTLRRFQDEVNEVRAGMECGIRIDGFSDFQVGDNIESFVIEKLAPKL